LTFSFASLSKTKPATMRILFLVADASELVVGRQVARSDSGDERDGKEPKQIEGRKFSGNWQNVKTWIACTNFDPANLVLNWMHGCYLLIPPGLQCYRFFET
jgi:hypothetical protein